MNIDYVEINIENNEYLGLFLCISVWVDGKFGQCQWKKNIFSDEKN